MESRLELLDFWTTVRICPSTRFRCSMTSRIHQEPGSGLVASCAESNLAIDARILILSSSRSFHCGSILFGSTLILRCQMSDVRDSGLFTLFNRPGAVIQEEGESIQIDENDGEHALHGISPIADVLVRRMRDDSLTFPDSPSILSSTFPTQI